MTLGERLADNTARRKKKGGLVVLLVVAAGGLAVVSFIWHEGGSEATIPSKEQVTRPDGARWLVTAETLRTSKGFEVVVLDDRDLEAQPRLDDLVKTDGRATVILSDPDHDALRAYLAKKLPAGWEDPFDYGIAWRYGNTFVHLTSSPADLV